MKHTVDWFAVACLLGAAAMVYAIEGAWAWLKCLLILAAIVAAHRDGWNTGGRQARKDAWDATVEEARANRSRWPESPYFDNLRETSPQTPEAQAAIDRAEAEWNAQHRDRWLQP